MSNEDTLRNIINSADSDAESCQDSIDSIQERIDYFQEKQNALKFILDETKTNLEDELSSTLIDDPLKFFTYGSYYNGSLLSISDNITNWQAFYKKSQDVIYLNENIFGIDGNAEDIQFIGTGPNDISVDSTSYILNEVVHYKISIDGETIPNTFKWSDSGGIEWNETNVEISNIFQDLNKNVRIRFNNTTGHVIDDSWNFWIIPNGCTIYFDGTNQTNKRVGGTVVSSVFDGTSITEITLNMGSNEIPVDLNGILQHIIEPYGSGWIYDSTSNVLISFIEEFNFANQYIHTPLGNSGTYGTKANIEALQTGKTIQQNNKTNAIESKTKLETYASPPST